MEKKEKTKNVRSLSSVIDRIVKESLKGSLASNTADEREKQKKMIGEEDDDLFGGEGEGSEEKSEKPENPETSKTVDDEKEKLKKGEIETKDVIEKLNAIRSGKSFKDEAISAKLDEYVSSLSKAEKVALLAFLKGLSQIVTGEVEAKTAVNPADPEPDVKMKKGEESKKQTKSIKPTVIKAPEKEKTEKKPSSEDTSGPVPIKPKKK